MTLVERSGEDYVALGAALLMAAQGGEVGVAATVVVPRTLVLGSAQSFEDAADAEIPVVKRGTGGGAVLCDAGVLLVDVAVPAGHALAPEDVTDAYRPFGELLVAVLADLGIAARTVTVAESRSLDDTHKAAARRACWAGLSPYEVVLLDGRKVVGLAQRRRRGAVLYQIAVHVTTPPTLVADYLVDGAALAPWLTATAALTEVESPSVLWDTLRAPLIACLDR